MISIIKLKYYNPSVNYIFYCLFNIKFVKIIFSFLEQNNINLSKIDNIFINQGPGQYTSIRSAISIVKALKISKKINIYGYYSTQIINNNYDILFNLLKEGRLTKNFIQPQYSN